VAAVAAVAAVIALDARTGRAFAKPYFPVDGCGFASAGRRVLERAITASAPTKHRT
jgi:hypothetical protein